MQGRSSDPAHPAAGQGDHATAPARRPAAFLDRDGVLNVDDGYVHRAEDLQLTKSAAKAVRLLNANGYLTVVVTNQSGVARGFYSEADVMRFHAALQHALGEHGARIDAFYHCPHHPAGIVPAFTGEHEDRKPNPGMLLRAMQEHWVDPARSFMIGDKASDMEAARRAGIAGYQVETNLCDLASEVRQIMDGDRWQRHLPSDRP